MSELKSHMVHGEKSPIAKRIEGISWGMFFVWVGIAFVASISYGVALIGIGLITLGAQVIRRWNHLHLEGFWILVGALFMIGGIWQLFDPAFALMPILLIIAGLIVILAVWKRKKNDAVE